MGLEEYGRGEKTILWMFGKLNDLVSDGLLKPGEITISLKGVAEYDQLRASGFKPSTEELLVALDGCDIAEDTETTLAIAQLIKLHEDRKIDADTYRADSE